MGFNKYRLKGAYHYDWYETELWYKACVDEIVDFCKGSTLDVGCGDGLLLSKLPEGSLGIDSDPDAIRLAREKGLNVTQISAYNFTSAKFDYLASLNVIEHLDHPNVLKNMILNLPIKGAIIMTLEWQGGAFGEDHKHEYTLEELTEFFKEFNPMPFRIKDFPEWIGVKIKK